MSGMSIGRALAALAVCVTTQLAAGQTAPIPHRLVRAHIDSGILANPQNEPGVLYTTVVEAPGASWVRLKFSAAALSGGSYLRMTSLADGAQQTLDLVNVGYWSNTSAYFNGDAVVLELIGLPGTTSRVAVSEFWAGAPAPAGTDTICGTVDDRQLSSDARQGRLMPIGCTAWLINDAAKCFLTAGHCISTGTTNAVVQFNVPLSTGSGQTVNPPPEHQYPVQQISIRSNGGGGTGNDMAYFGTNTNSVSGLTAYQRQGAAYSLENAPAVAGQMIRITGYGTTSSPVSPTWSQVQKTHVGPYVSLTGTTVRYATDTTGGNSGSPVINEATGKAIGIHTHGGCNSSGGSNIGTAIQHPTLQGYLANPGGVCIPTAPACYPDCNQDTVLNLSDFGCFQTRFAASEAYADCNGDGLRNLSDFGCFQTKFAIGCP